MTNQIRKRLHSKLQRSLTSNKNCSLDSPQLFASDKSTNSSTGCETNAAEDGLVEHLHVLGVLETCAWDAVCRSSSFGDDEVAIAEVATD